MLTFIGRNEWRPGNCSRRDMLQVGALAFGGLTLAELMRRRASATAQTARGKSVIMIWVRGGPSHIDSYDMKPEAPAEIRGEFRPIATNLPGISLCELMPLHATIMNKLAIVRGIKSNDLGDHTPHYILTGCPDRGKRPVLGAVVSHLQPRSDGLPPYVSLTRVDGRDHWPEAGAAVVAGGGFRMGQTIGETDRHGARSLGKPYTPANVLANLYSHLGIDPASMLRDLNGRPIALLDDREPVRELL
jgi:hypothetical protein